MHTRPKRVSLGKHRSARNQQHQVERLTIRGKKPALAEIALKERDGYIGSPLLAARFFLEQAYVREAFARIVAYACAIDRETPIESHGITGNENSLGV